VVDANEAAAAIFGVSRPELLALPAETRFAHFLREDGTAWPPDELPAPATFATGESHHRTVIGVTLDDELRWLSCTTIPLRDAAGAVEYVVATFVDVTAERAAAERIAWRALHDELTGLANRALLYERLEGSLAVRRGRERGGPYAILYCDLDGFKNVNDRYGHAVGDALLVAAAARLSGVMREHDLVARWGGDEFVVLVDGLEGAALLEFGERLRRAIAAPFNLLDESGNPITLGITLSVGVALAGSSARTVIRSADLALYEAKRRGRNRVVNAPVALAGQ
jgi:diguanylate cyclase (GGDEF)-like protein